MVTVIIPIYNIENVLEECVTSVLKQTYSNLEILLVDDGSTDKSAAICDRFAEQDKRVNALHKSNGGLSDARNYGLAHAHGKYIFYLDGDDWLTDNAIQLLRETAEQHHADIVQCEYYYAYETYLLTRKSQGSIIEFSKEDALKELISNGRIKNFAWANLIKKELAEKVLFLKGKYFEDSYWKYKIIDYSTKFIYLPQPLLYYRQRGNSISSTFSPRNLDLLIGNGERVMFIKEKYPQLFNLALREHWLISFSFMKLSESSTRENAELFESYYKKFTYQNYIYLDKALKDKFYTRCLYFIHTHCKGMYPIFTFIDRVYRKFLPGIYTCIKY